MNNYEKPIVVNTNEMFEAVYAESGYVEEPSASASVHWSNHNSGSLSCVSVNVSTGNIAGTFMKVVVTLPNCLIDVGDFSGELVFKFNSDSGDVEAPSSVFNEYGLLSIKYFWNDFRDIR